MVMYLASLSQVLTWKACLLLSDVTMKSVCVYISGETHVVIEIDL